MRPFVRVDSRLIALLLLLTGGTGSLGQGGSHDCAQRLERIIDGLTGYRLSHGRFPGSLEALIPTFVPSAADLHCPLGDSVFLAGGDSSGFEFQYRRGDSGGGDIQDYVGWMGGRSSGYTHAAPLLRCPQGHFETAEDSIYNNATYEGSVYRSQQYWERHWFASGDLVSALLPLWERQLVGVFSQRPSSQVIAPSIALKHWSNASAGLPWFMGPIRVDEYNRGELALGDRFLPLSGCGSFHVHGVSFALDGLLQLDGGNSPFFLPESGDIDLERNVSRVHLLHGVFQFEAGDAFRRETVADGSYRAFGEVRILKMDVHSGLGDGDPEIGGSLDIEFLRDCTPYFDISESSQPGPKPIWVGETEYKDLERGELLHLRNPLFLSTWENPYPGSFVHSVAFSAPHIGSVPLVPFVVAIAVE